MFRLVTLLRFNLMPAGSPEDGEEAPGEQRPDAAATLDGERVARAVTRVYARMRYAAAIITLVLGAVYLGAMILWGSVPLKGLIERITTRTPGVVALYVIAFTLVYKLVTLPVGYWRGYVVEHRFGLSNESVGRWLRNEVVGTLLSLVLIVPLMSIVYVLLARSPDTWWIWAAGVWVLFAVVLGKLYPIVILPLFHKQTPVEDEALRDRLSALCAKYEFGVEGVYSFNYSRSTKKANAFLTGFGKTRRVLLADTLLSSFTHDEIETIFAHELGHFVRADLLKSLLWGAALTFVSFFVADRLLEVGIRAMGLQGIADVAGLPLLFLALAAVGVVSVPLQNVLTRRMEWQCDLWAMRRTKKPDAFASAMRKLATMNLSEVTPGRLAQVFFHSHPTIRQRLLLAEAETRRQQRAAASSESETP